MNTLSVLTMDTTNEDEIRKLDNIGIKFIKSDLLSDDEKVIDVPFKTLQQKKDTIRELQKRMVDYAKRASGFWGREE